MPAATKPLLLLDIDGALCPLAPRVATDAHVLWATRTEYVSRDLPAWLERLSREFDLRWASTWEHEANGEFASSLGVGELAHVVVSHGTQLTMGSSATWKLSDVTQYAGGRAMAWVDDELFDDAFTWASQRDREVPALLAHQHCPRAAGSRRRAAARVRTVLPVDVSGK